MNSLTLINMAIGPGSVSRYYPQVIKLGGGGHPKNVNLFYFLQCPQNIDDFRQKYSQCFYRNCATLFITKPIRDNSVLLFTQTVHWL